jgi:hypothetical protein
MALERFHNGWKRSQLSSIIAFSDGITMRLVGPSKDSPASPATTPDRVKLSDDRYYAALPIAAVLRPLLKSSSDSGIGRPNR